MCQVVDQNEALANGGFPVVGSRPSTPFRPGGLVVSNGDEPIVVAALALLEADRAAMVDLLERSGRPHPTGAITTSEDCLTDSVRFTSRSPTRGQLREAVVVQVPSNQSGGLDPTLKTQIHARPRIA
jgi:hypothetical protein